MPTQENSEALPLGKETKKEKASGTSANGALAVSKPNTETTPEPMPNLMSKNQALAIAWTGIEALALMKHANLYRSPKTGRVVIELLDTEYTTANGLVSVGTPK